MVQRLANLQADSVQQMLPCAYGAVLLELLYIILCVD